ncbi:MAG TPA: methyltransferase domain-containing protein [Pirellulales bacterium]|nr:methyltransferase domain-containing protein [Pirellulales bacterium]
MASSDLEIVENCETAVRTRYAAAAQAAEAALCCPVEYNPDYLALIPAEVLERDYGCGDPTPYVRPGETVLDLGSGGGKVCYIAAQLVGPQGRVIGVDCNQEMLSLARGAQAAFAERLGYANVEFRCGLIQDLALDLDLLAGELTQRPVRDQAGWLELRSLEDRLRREQPLVPSESVDCVVSNCVLNLVQPQDRERLLAETFRVLKPGGRAAISDIVADRDVPEPMQRDAELWSGCISGAYREERFVEAFEQAGFYGIQIVKREARPWRVVEGIEFRAVTLLAYKGQPAPGGDATHEVIYRGPFKQVEDDAGRQFPRGRRVAVCEQTFELFEREPYAGHFAAVAPQGTPHEAPGGGERRCC